MLFYSQALLVHFGAVFISMGLCRCVSACVCVFTCTLDVLGKSGERGQIAASLSHIICSELSFIQRNESAAPPSTCTDRYDACLCPLLSSKNTHNTPSVYACECNAFCVRRCDRFQIHHNLVSLRDLDCSF